MVNGRYHVVYEFEGKGPVWKTYPSEEDYRNAHEDRQNVNRIHDDLGEQQARDLFLRLDHEFGVRTGRKEISDIVE